MLEIKIEETKALLEQGAKNGQKDTTNGDVDLAKGDVNPGEEEKIETYKGPGNAKSMYTPATRHFDEPLGEVNDD